MSRADLIRSSNKEKRELEKTVNDINFFYKVACTRLGITPGDQERAELTKEQKQAAFEYFEDRTYHLREEVTTYINLGYSEEESLKRILPKAYGLVKAASDFLWQKPHYDSQLKGGILLNDGYASEMATGEGKTLTATLPTYLNALLGKGAHVLTPNEYLARRDFEEMSQLYELLGLSCGLVEDRGILSEDAIKEKQKSILEPELEKYLASAKTEEEKKKLEAQFFEDKSNQSIIVEARKMAIEALEAESKVKRKKAYASDITYGSSSAVAFDYLYDDIEVNSRKKVQRKEKPNFVVIDEVDAVLFDDATMPYTISGYANDKERDITEEERKTQEERIELAEAILKRIEIESSKLMASYGGKYNLVHELTDTNYQNLLSQQKEMEKTRLTARKMEQIDKNAVFNIQNRAIIINKTTKEFFITEVGETIFYQYFCDEEIKELLKENADEIKSLKYDDGELVFKEGEHYSIDSAGNIVMDPVSLNYLISSGAIPELSIKRNEFLASKFVEYRPYINNAIMAWHVLKENDDYKLSVPKQAKSENERVITLVTNGRTAEGRVYSNGLQQALEKKVQREKPKLKIKENKMTITLASIPTASFFGRYNKIAGMTGTSAINAFRNLYGLETKAVPRNKPKKVIDRGDILYPNEQAKLEGVLEEVAVSYKKGQPVLITATTIEESQKIADYLTRKLPGKLKEKYPNEEFPTFDIPVLNANVDLEREAKIVSRAGKKGAITIATEMAGRGTDIKLGGEPPTLEEVTEKLASARAKATLEKAMNDGKIKPENSDFFYSYMYKRFLESTDVQKQAQRKYEEELETSKKEIKEIKQQIEQAGGLKVIGVGHFGFTRNDDQIKGRCGRQGDPGEVVFVNDPNDLIKIGVSQEQVKQLKSQAEKSPIVENPNRGYTPIGDAVYEAQYRNEGMREDIIKAEQEIETEISKYRRDFTRQKNAIKESKKYIDIVEFMIEETVKNVLIGATSKLNPAFNDQTHLKVAKLDYKELEELASEFLGVSVKEEELKKFTTLGELREHLTNKSVGIFKERVKTEGKEKINTECEEMINKMFGRVWSHFEEFIVVIKEQDSLNKLAQYQGGTELPVRVLEAYKHAVETERGILVRSIVNQDYVQKLATAEEAMKEADRKTESAKKTLLDAERKAKTARREAEKDVSNENKKALAEQTKQEAEEKRKQLDQAQKEKNKKAAELEKAKSRSEIFPVRVTVDGVERVHRDYDQKMQEEVERHKEDAKDFVVNRIKNLRPFAKMFTLMERVKINKKASEVGHGTKDEEVESVPFEDQNNPKGKK